MLKHVRNAVVCCVLVTVSPCCSVPTPPVSTVKLVDPSASDKAFGVDAFMHANLRPGQAVSVEGVVARVDAQQRILALIDKAEYKECSVTSCAALYLPIRWNGAMPTQEDTVIVQGAVTDDGGKLIFVAKEVRKSPSTQDQAKQ